MSKPFEKKNLFLTYS